MKHTGMALRLRPAGNSHMQRQQQVMHFSTASTPPMQTETPPGAAPAASSATSSVLPRLLSASCRSLPCRQVVQVGAELGQRNAIVPPTQLYPPARADVAFDVQGCAETCTA